MESITPIQFLDWSRNYEKALKANTPLRKGQHFCNYFHIQDTSLFYSTDLKTIDGKIRAYVSQSDRSPSEIRESPGGDDELTILLREAFSDLSDLGSELPSEW